MESETGKDQVSRGTIGERQRGFVMLGWRRGTPRWADDPVWRRDRWCRQTGKEANYPLEGSMMTEGAGRGEGKLTM